ncbi:MAG: dihydropteroate synthase [Pseudomonadota bacterium]
MSERIYLRPIPHGDAAQTAFADWNAETGLEPDGYARWLAGGPERFDRVEPITRDLRSGSVYRGPLIAPDALPAPPEEQAERVRLIRRRLETERAPAAGVRFERPLVMGVVNVTPDSFSDGGRNLDPTAAIASALQMVEDGADILDIGGESTRPGAPLIPAAEEWARVGPVIEGLKEAGCRAPISIDTRKASVAQSALKAGARLLNDVSALTFDPESMSVAGEFIAKGGAVCLMHALGDPKTMQDDPRYDDVVLDIYDYLERRVAACEAAGLVRDCLIVDPGIGFGKTLGHNVALLRSLSLFQGLGCPVLLGASRKRFVGTLTEEPEALRRAPGSVAVALMGAVQGAQILRVHDVRETAQALRMQHALRHGRFD